MAGRCSIYIMAHIDAAAVQWAAPSKIGISVDPVSRVATLQTGNPNPIGVYWSAEFPHRGMASDLETFFHDSFKAKRLEGEWFDVAPEQVHQAFMAFCNFAVAAILADRPEWRTT